MLIVCLVICYYDHLNLTLLKYVFFLIPWQYKLCTLTINIYRNTLIRIKSSIRLDTLFYAFNIFSHKDNKDSSRTENRALT